MQHSGIMPLHRMNVYLHGCAGPVSINLRPGAHTLLVGFGFAGVFVNPIRRALPILHWEDIDDKWIDWLFARVTHLRLHWNNGACPNVDWHLLDGEAAINCQRASEVLSGWPFDPLTFWYPNVFDSKLRCAINGLRNGSRKHVFAKHVLVPGSVCLRCLRPVVIERAQKCYTCVIGASRFGVDVGLQSIT